MFILLLPGISLGFPRVEEPGSETPRSGTMSGTIRDDGNGQAVEFATIAIYSNVDSSLVDGTITDASGQFTIESLPFGD